MNTKSLRLGVTLLCIIVAMAGNLQAQGLTATILGRVFDQSGAVVPGARIVVTNLGTGYKQEAVTNESGSYTLPALPTGPYSVEATMQGFGTPEAKLSYSEHEPTGRYRPNAFAGHDGTNDRGQG
jgi:hypothetical protein